MAVFQETLSLRTRGAGTHEFTGELAGIVKRSGLSRGVVQVFCQHTSCSLVIMENADPSARRDLEAWFDRLVPEDDPHFTKWRSPGRARRCHSPTGDCCSAPGRACSCGNTAARRTRVAWR